MVPRCAICQTSLTTVAVALSKLVWLKASWMFGVIYTLNAFTAHLQKQQSRVMRPTTYNPHQRTSDSKKPCGLPHDKHKVGILDLSRTTGPRQSWEVSGTPWRTPRSSVWSPCKTPPPVVKENHCVPEVCMWCLIPLDLRTVCPPTGCQKQSLASCLSAGPDEKPLGILRVPCVANDLAWLPHAYTAGNSFHYHRGNTHFSLNKYTYKYTLISQKLRGMHSWQTFLRKLNSVFFSVGWSCYCSKTNKNKKQNPQSFRQHTENMKVAENVFHSFQRRDASIIAHSSSLTMGRSVKHRL